MLRSTTAANREGFVRLKIETRPTGVRSDRGIDVAFVRQVHSSTDHRTSTGYGRAPGGRKPSQAPSDIHSTQTRDGDASKFLSYGNCARAGAMSLDDYIHLDLLRLHYSNQLAKRRLLSMNGL